MCPFKTKIISQSSTENIEVLSRRVRWGERGVMCQHDTCGRARLNRPNTVQTSAADAPSEDPGPLEQERLNNNSSHVARCLFLSQDRADITSTVNGLCQRMSNLTKQSLLRSKRLVKHSKGEKQWRHIFSYDQMSTEVATYSDSLWAGDKETRKILKCGRDTVLRSHVESIYTKTSQEAAQNENNTQQHSEHQNRRELCR